MKILIVSFILIALGLVWVFAFNPKRHRITSPTKVLLCSVGVSPEFKELSKSDAEIYRKYYSEVDLVECAQAADLMSRVTQSNYKICHLFLKIGSDGNVDTTPIKTVLEKCKNSGAKAIIIANDHAPEIYIKQVNVEGVNLVMTMERKGNFFTSLLDGLLQRMSKGKTMPLAWVDMAPQSEGPHQEDKPGCIFAAGAGSEIFLGKE